MNPTVYILRGLFAFILGLILVIWPASTLEIILILFPIFAIIDGTSAILIGSRTIKQGKWLSFVPMGILEIFIGIFVFIWPQATLEAFTLLVALWAFVLGLGELFTAFSDHAMKNDIKWLYGIGGILTVILGVFVIIYPIITSVALMWLFGLFFLIYGFTIFIVGIMLNKKVLHTSPAK